ERLKTATFTGGACTTDTLQSTDRQAWETGHCSFNVDTPAGTRTAAGRYMTYWKRQADGAWMIEANVAGWINAFAADNAAFAGVRSPRFVPDATEPSKSTSSCSERRSGSRRPACCAMSRNHARRFAMRRSMICRAGCPRSTSSAVKMMYGQPRYRE